MAEVSEKERAIAELGFETGREYHIAMKAYDYGYRRGLEESAQLCEDEGMREACAVADAIRGGEQQKYARR